MTRRIIVVSHPCVIEVNQLPYVSLQRRGWEVHLVTPARWSDEYRPEGFPPAVHPELEERARTVAIVLKGRPQQHAYIGRLGRHIDDVRPLVAIVEQEPVSVAAAQWARALRRRGVPYGLQAAENLDRRHPLPARVIRRGILPTAAFIMARSPRAAELIRTQAAEVVAEVVPHAVPPWPPEKIRSGRASANGGFVVGFAGRLVEEKGLRDLVGATALMAPGVRLVVYGNGPLREELRAASNAARRIDVVTDLPHGQMADAYASMDVLALPSRSTPGWTEQFGRVLVEAMACQRPVVAAGSGEIPWVIEVTGGGLLFPEGDVVALAHCLETLRENPDKREHLAQTGAHSVSQLFTPEAVAERLDDLLKTALAVGP